MSFHSEKTTFNEDSFIVNVKPSTEEKQDDLISQLKYLNGLIDFEYDSVYGSKPDTVTEVYTFKEVGVTVGTITITYEDSTKEFILSAIKN